MRKNQLSVLVASAVISAAILYTICSPKWAPSSAAQTVKISKPPAADIKKATSSPDVHDAPSGRGSASAVQPKGEMPKTAEAKTSKSNTVLMVPPPPPTPCVLPPGFESLAVQSAQQNAAPQQQSQQAQAQTATREDTQQSDEELKAVDEELQAALRSSNLRVHEWKR